MFAFLRALRSEAPNLVLLIAWVVVNVALFVADYRKYLEYDEFFYLRAFVGHGLPLARATALCLKLNSALVLVPVCRNLLLLLRSIFVNCPEPAGRSTRRLLDSHVIHHKWVARSLVLFTIIHVGAHVFNVERLCAAFDSANGTLMALSRFPDNFPDAPVEHFVNPIRKTTPPFAALLGTVTGATGVLTTIALLLIWTSAFRIVRIYAFEAFWVTHHLFVVYYIGLGTHGLGGFVRSQTNVAAHSPSHCLPRISSWGNLPDCPFPTFAPSPPTAWMWIVGPIALYLVERVVKLVRTRHPYRLAAVVLHPSDVTELRLVPAVGQRPRVSPGQYVALQCPTVSRFEWHPFTVTSAPDDEFVGVHVRAVGDWTRAVARKCEKEEEGARQPVALDRAPIFYLDGPFGAASEEWFSYESSVFVGAGIGVTPFASVLKHLYNKRRQRQMLFVKAVHFFWIAPDVKAFEWFRDLLHSLEVEDREGRGGGGAVVGGLLSYHIFLTRGWDPKRAMSIARRDKDSTYDEFSQLHHRTEFGRPNWPVELRRIVAPREDGARIGVFLCGPKPLAEELKRACREVNESVDTGTRLYFNKEHF